MKEGDKDTQFVSVIMAVHSGDNPGFFAMALRSILDQTYRSIEFIVVADGPLTLDLRRIVEETLSEHPHTLRFLQLEVSGGPGRARNHGIAAASGSYIAIMDADDLAHPMRIEKQLRFMLSSTSDLISCNYQIVNERNEVVGQRSLPLDHEGIRRAMPFYNPICNPAVMAKSELLKQFPYDPELRFGEDYRLWVKLMLNGAKFANHPEMLLSYRQDAGFHARRRGVGRAWADAMTKLKTLSGVRSHLIPLVMAMATAGYFYRLLPAGAVRRSYEIRRWLTALLLHQ